MKLEHEEISDRRAKAFVESCKYESKQAYSEKTSLDSPEASKYLTR